MPLEQPLPSGPPSVGRHRARARLVALTIPPDPPAAAVAERSRDDAAPSPPAPLGQRWLPAALREGRWDAGRPGARALAVVAAVAAVLAAAAVWWDRPVPEAVPALPVLPATHGAPGDAVPPVAGPPVELVVSVVGRVVKPGLVRVPDGARVADALAAAGGPLPDTDLLGLNLARRVGDGEQLLVGVPPPPGVVSVDGGGVGTPPAGGPGPVDLNTASLEQLDALPGVGPVTARRILDWRTAHGRFTAVEQLREVDGIGEARYATLRDLVRV